MKVSQRTAWANLEAGIPQDPAEQLFWAARETGPFVYFIQEDESDVVKIGWANEPFDRLTTLQTGNPRELVLRWLIVGDVKVEQRLQAVFSDACIRGEWFEDCGILRLAEHIAQQQLEVFERGMFVERDLARVVDRAIKERRMILA